MKVAAAVLVLALAVLLVVAAGVVAGWVGASLWSSATGR